MGEILVGTASWTDATLIKCGRFYPRGCSSAEARLRHYANVFPLVEVDSSYYALPSIRNAELWAERTPDDFVFNVKAFRTLTGHQTPRRALPQDILRALNLSADGAPVYANTLPPEIVDELWRRYLEALQPLKDAGKLKALHFQFPPWFTAKRQSYDYLEEVRQRLTGYLVAVEFRHESWMTEDRRDATLAFEAQHGFVNVVVDEPQGARNSIPSVWAITNPELAIVRLHGRNEATWNLKDSTSASDRFNYDYNAEELAALAEPIQQLASSVVQVHAIFNNNFEDQGQRNGQTLMKLIGGVRRQTRL
ncbi:DUF72 domain-containing protein [Tahibacter sp.]|uniref:DUF72 domain-containing protein n=1 Tax=Tahibacter sp. TaxID=2056211 RepID=UPI0028C42D54|nr:DUF72 domain-containing protein [Tahibacter sp.]